MKLAYGCRRMKNYMGTGNKKMKYIKLCIAPLLLVSLLNPVFAGDSSQVLIFVSFSMPKTSLKSWMHDANTIHAPVIIRGLVNNSFKATTASIYELVKEGSGGMQIDPILFERFQIKKVPAVVVTQLVSCLPNQSCLENYDVFYGDAGLEYALKQIEKQEDDISPIAEKALQTLKKAPYA